MPSSRELVEAAAYERRRLVRAFLSGRPDGPLVEPVRSWRWLTVGATLTVLIVGGQLALRAYA